MNLRTCLEYLERITTTRPTHADCWNLLGLAQAQSGDLEEAIASFDRAIGINPSYAKARISRCFAEVELGHSARGFRELRRLLNNSPDDFNILLPFGVFCMRFGWKDTGAAQLVRAERMRPNVPYVLACSAAAQREIGNESEAQRRVERASKIVDDLKLDELFEGVSANVEDLDYYAKWRNPILHTLPIVSADVDRAEGRAEDAQATLLHANARFPGQSDLMVARGRHLLGKDDPEGAQRWLTTAILMDDHCHGAYFELAFLHRALDDEELSRRSLEKAVSLRPLYPDYRYQLGVMLLDQGKFDEGIVQLERVRLLNPSYGHCSLHLASAYMEKNCPAQALDALSTPAVRDWTEALLLEAGVHIQSGDPSRATECLENVLEREPDHEEAQEILAKLEAVG